MNLARSFLGAFAGIETRGGKLSCKNWTQLSLTMVCIRYADPTNEHNGADLTPDALLERNARILHLPAAAERHTASLSNWIEFTGSICRNETGFLQESDLCTIAKSGDDGLSTTEQFVERSFVWFLSCSGRVSAALSSNHLTYSVFNLDV